MTQLLAAQQIVVDTDELDYNLFDLSLSLRNLVVRAADPSGGPAFASIGRARLDLSLFQLVRGRYVVESAVLDGLTVHYLVREDGTDNLPRPLRQPDAPSEPIAYLIDALSTETASVRYEDRLRHVDVTLPIARLAIDGNQVSGRHRIDFETTPTTATVQDRTARIDRVSGRFDVGQNDVAIEQLDLSGEGANIALTGAIDDFDRPRAKLTLRATADVASAVRLAGLDQPASGAVELEAAIAGDLGRPGDRRDRHRDGTRRPRPRRHDGARDGRLRRSARGTRWCAVSRPRRRSAWSPPRESSPSSPPGRRACAPRPKTSTLPPSCARSIWTWSPRHGWPPPSTPRGPASTTSTPPERRTST